MVGILGNIFAGAAAGGAKEYTDVMDNRIEDKREAKKQAALEKRMKSLAKYNYDLQRKATLEDRAYQEGKENRADADARNMAALLRNEELAPGILSSTGGDEYSAPMTEEDLTQSMSGKGQLAYEEKKRAMEKEEKAETRADRSMEIAEEELRLRKQEMQERLKRLDAKTEEQLSVKDEKDIREIAKDRVYTAMGYQFDPLDKTYVTEDMEKIPPQEKAQLDQMVDALTAKVTELRQTKNMSVSQAFMALTQNDDTDRDMSATNPRSLPPGTYTGDTPPVKGAMKASNGAWYTKNDDGTYKLWIDPPKNEEKPGLLSTTGENEPEKKDQPEEKQPGFYDWEKEKQVGKKIGDALNRARKNQRPSIW